jgi:ATP-dependent Clp endopeptidase proteolytic subunit ClpP
VSVELSKLPPELVAAKAAALNAEAKAFGAAATEHMATAAWRNAEAVRSQAEADATLIGLTRENEKRQRELASDYDTRFYRFFKSVGEASSQSCIAQFAQWWRVDKANGIENPHYKLQFNSPGGSVFDGLALFDELQHFRRQGVKITTSTIGMAASMAGILLQAGDVRVMSPESWMLIHKTSFGAIGNFDEVQDRVKMLDRVQDRILGIFTARAKEAEANGTCDKAITRSQIERRWDRKDWWLSSDEALKFGLVDEVR